LNEILMETEDTMLPRDYSDLIEILEVEYQAYAPKSAAIQKRAEKVLVDGGSHTLRLIKPFPPRIVSASGAYIVDEDGHNILDFWQGHYANILGHNPPVVTEALATNFSGSGGLQTGFVDRLQAELAEILCQQTSAEKVRFTTSGTLATMYSMLLARAATGREMMLKVGGGWHGAHLWGLKGVGHKQGFKQVDSVGVPDELAEDVLVTQFNQTQKLEDVFKIHGECLACFIVEPVIGAGGMFPASLEYLQTARELCDKYGTVLIFDEVISGFRYRAGDVGALYGVEPDLFTMGKIVGGGMPVAVVGGNSELMDLAGRAGGRKVKFSGGTYSGHPASMLATKTMVEYLVAHEEEVYPRLGKLSHYLRGKVLQVFTDAGILAQFTGEDHPTLPPNSMHMLVFPYQDGVALDSPDQVLDPLVCDVELAEKVFKLGMLLEDIHIIHGCGAVSTAHTEYDIDRLCEGYQKVLQKILV
jgi:glutamate-1-semialdehyde 2,1-aminomutase